ncbi:hypothetical protein [Endozoicomonas sp.]|uniref:hypothetical protein n=1 Tax=Endozoicomonas sp. TaxID=1892382 RepID=UPI00383B5DFE
MNGLLAQACNSLFRYSEVNNHDNKGIYEVTDGDINSASTIASGPNQSEVKGVNPQVHNYRMLTGTAAHGLKYINALLQYCRSVPIAQRGISILVVNNHNEQLLLEQPSLTDQLVDEGVKITSIQSVADYMSEYYPRAKILLFLLMALPLKPGRDRLNMCEGETHEKLLSFILSMLLPDYAFSKGNDGLLKAVTVAHPGLLSSIHLPATAISKETADILETAIWVDGTQKRYLFDGRELIRLIHHRSGSTGGSGNKLPFHPMLTFASDVFSLTGSAEDARKRAAVIEEISDKYLKVPLFSTREFYDSEARSLMEMESLESFVLSYQHQVVDLCFAENVEHGNETTNLNVRCTGNYQEFLRFFFLVFSKYFNNQYSIPRLKDLALKHNIQWRHDYFDSVDQTPDYVSAENSSSGYRFTLYAPDISFYSRQRENLENFVSEMALDAEVAGIKYLFTDSFRDFGFPRMPGISDADSPCHPLMNVSHLPAFFLGMSGEQEMPVYQEMLDSYPPSAKHCIPPSMRQATESVNGAAEDGTSESAYQSMGSGFQYGMLAGFLDGCGSHFNRAHWFRNPVVSGCLGYLAGGPAGAVLGLGSHFLHRLPVHLRRGAQPGSLRSGCATIVEAVNMGLPLLTKGIYHHAGSIGGYILGKYGTESTLGRLRPREVSQPCPDSSDSPRRNRRTEKSSRAPAECTNKAASEKTVSTAELLEQLIEAHLGITDTSGGNEHLQDIVRLTVKLLSEDDSLAMLEQTTMAKLADILPWSTMDDVKVKVVINYQPQDRTVYLQEKCEQCKQASGGLSAAVSRFPGLYLNYLKSFSGTVRIDRAWLDNLWKVLDRDSDETLVVETGKRVIDNSSGDNKTKTCETTLLDDKLSSSARLAIIKSLSSDFQLELCQGGVLAKLGAEHLANVKKNPDGCKQKEAKHIRGAIEQWVSDSGKLSLSDNLIHLLIKFTEPEYAREASREVRSDTSIRNDFHNKLTEQATELITSTDVAKRLRAKAVQLQLLEVTPIRAM